MHRCLQLAVLGIRKTAPNPMVGAVIVHQDKIIGEGYHTRYGAPHAEIEAINSVEDKRLLKESTLYVSLEPCNHTGKTPPCTDAILQHGIKKVVVAHTDPFAAVNGAGIARLRQNGVEVMEDVLADEARFINRRFITYHTKKRPYIILKWAMSADGFMGIAGENIRISNEESRILSHQWRAEEQAILVGGGTVMTDDPLLDTRMWPGENPMRIVLDKRGNLPAGKNVFNGKQATLVLTTSASARYQNATTIHLDGKSGYISQAMDVLFKHEIQSVLVEGGKTTLQDFLEAGLWDEMRIFISEERLHKGLLAPEIPNLEASESTIGNNKLKTLFNTAK